MLFNSFSYLIFLPLVLLCFYLAPKQFRKFVLIAAGFTFYGFFDVRYLSLLLVCIVFDFAFGIYLSQEGLSTRKRKAFLTASLSLNLALLAYFKYFGAWTGLVLPVGISFYTFQSMSYVIDVYRREMPAVKKLTDYALFVSFFPPMVAGPIERAKTLLPQLMQTKPMHFVRLKEAFFLIAYGLFKKVSIADGLSKFVDSVYANPAQVSGTQVFCATLAFTIQIYADFSGYSDIAIGSAKLFGVDLSTNFRFPYLSATPAEFWRRWHISLSSWLRDYLYISLGGNKGGSFKTKRNLLLTMILGGIWHGASFKFMAWGFYHGLLLILFRPIENWKWKKTLIPVFFLFTVYGWLIFRVNEYADIGVMTRALFKSEKRMIFNFDSIQSQTFLCLIAFVFFETMLILRKKVDFIFETFSLGLLLSLLITLILMGTANAPAQFIYFQF